MNQGILIPPPSADKNARLAFELAVDLKPIDRILREYELDASELRRMLVDDPQLRNQINDIRKSWNSHLSAQERTQLKAALMAEDGLEDLWGMYVNQEIHPGVRVDIHKYLAKLGCVEPKPDAAAGGSRFHVTINLPNVEPMEVIANVPPQSQHGMLPGDIIDVDDADG